MYATSSVPPLTMSASIFSAPATRMTSSTEAFIARLQGDDSVAAVCLCVTAARARNPTEQPATVASGRAVPGEPLLKDRDAKRRVGLLEVVRRPETGESRTHDADVDVRWDRSRLPDVTRECQARSTRTRRSH